MAAHYTYLQSIIPDPNWQKLVLAGALGLSMIVLGKKATAGLKTAEGIDDNIVPARKPTLTGVFDLLVESFIAFHDSTLGKENRRFVPLCGTLFFFILFSNLLGLIPGVPAIATTVWINVALAVVVYISFNFYGIREQGIVSYLKHMAGPMMAVAVLIFPVEVLSHLLRILTLNLRLYWNITADHLVLGVFTDLVWGIPILFYAMGTFVAFMQAFVFTILTMIYIQMGVSHEEEGHH